MLERLISRYSSSIIVTLIRSITSSSDLAIANQMKLLNNEKNYEQALNLFDMHRKNQRKPLLTTTIMQALKACANIGDLQRGIIIHNLVLSRIQNDSYILFSLIDLYSKIVK